MRLPAMNQTLLARHAWRQTQTAFTVRMFERDGVDLLRPQVPVFGRPWTVVYELPLYQAVAAALASFGMSTDSAVRWTSLIFFVICAALIRAVGRRIVSGHAGDVAAIVFIACPFGLFWSRASLPEYPVLAVVLGGFYCALRWRPSSGHHRIWLLSTVALMGLAGAMKASTAAVWLLPVAVALWSSDEPVVGGPVWRRRRHFAIALTVLVTVGTAVAWTAWAEHVKRASPMSAVATTTGMLQESVRALPYLGTQAVWGNPWRAVVSLQMGGPVILAGVGIALWRRRRQPIVVALAAMVPGAVIAFPVQFGVHDYYSIAVSPAVALLVGVALCDLVGVLRRRMSAPAAVGAAGATWTVAAVIAGAPFIHLTYDRNHSDNVDTMSLAAEVRSATAADEVVAAAGFSWTPEWLYMADRRGSIASDSVPVPSVQQAWKRDRVRSVVLAGPLADYRLFDVWPRLDAIGPHVVRVRETPAGSPAQQPEASGGAVLTVHFGTTLPAGAVSTSRPSVIRCDGSPIPGIGATDGASFVVLAVPNARGQRFHVEGFVDLPVRDTLIVRPRSTTRPGPNGVTDVPPVTCRGGGSLHVTGVWRVDGMQIRLR